MFSQMAIQMAAEVEFFCHKRDGKLFTTHPPPFGHVALEMFAQMAIQMAAAIEIFATHGTGKIGMLCPQMLPHSELCGKLFPTGGTAVGYSHVRYRHVHGAALPRGKREATKEAFEHQFA
jgi:hypothetical protein